MAGKIPPELIEPVLQKAAASVGFREIAAWLGEAHGVTVSHMAVARVVQRESKQRAASAKSIARTALARTVRTDLDRLELYARKAMRIAKTVESEPEVWVKVAKELRGILTDKLRIAGVETPDEAKGGGVSLDDLAEAMKAIAANDE